MPTMSWGGKPDSVHLLFLGLDYIFAVAIVQAFEGSTLNFVEGGLTTRNRVSSFKPSRIRSGIERGLWLSRERMVARERVSILLIFVFFPATKLLDSIILNVKPDNGGELMRWGNTLKRWQ
ncbi:hypothetical protein ES703_117025 [subsurface metagenome]